MGIPTPLTPSAKAELWSSIAGPIQPCRERSVSTTTTTSATSRTAAHAASGWRERVESGIYRAHRVGCPASRDRRPGRRCGCSFQILVPGSVPGRTRMLTIRGTITEARTAKRHGQASGRPRITADPASCETLDEFAGRYLRAKEGVFSPHTTKSVETEYRLRISPALGHLRLDEITRERVELWLADLVGRASSRRMVTQAVATLRMVLSTAVSWGRITVNPASRLRLPLPSPTKSSGSSAY